MGLGHCGACSPFCQIRRAPIDKRARGPSDRGFGAPLCTRHVSRRASASGLDRLLPCSTVRIILTLTSAASAAAPERQFAGPCRWNELLENFELLRIELRGDPAGRIQFQHVRARRVQASSLRRLRRIRDRAEVGRSDSFDLCKAGLEQAGRRDAKRPTFEGARRRWTRAAEGRDARCQRRA